MSPGEVIKPRYCPGVAEGSAKIKISRESIIKSEKEVWIDISLFSGSLLQNDLLQGLYRFTIIRQFW